MDFTLLGIIIYIIGLIGWLFLWKIIPGYHWLKHYKLMWIPFLLCIFVFIMNIWLTSIAEIPEYNVEIGIYGFVEDNAKTIAAYALGIAVFVVLTLEKQLKILDTKESKLFITLIFTSFLVAVIGALPLYWIPQKFGWLTILRHLKTVPFTYSIFLFAAGILVYIHMFRIKSEKDPLRDLSIKLKLHKREKEVKETKIQWDPNLSVDNNEIDEQHKMLIQQAGELSDAINKGKDLSYMYDTMSFLIDYTTYHFGTEERYMKVNKYPKYDSHKARHEEFKETLKVMAQDLIDKGATVELAEKVNVLLINWLLDHIKGVDQELGRFLSTSKV